MSKVTTQTYDVSLGDDTIVFNGLKGVDKLSYHLQGDGTMNGTVTVKLQETNVAGLGQKDIVNATAIADANTNEYVGYFDVGGDVVEFNVVTGGTTVGVISIIIRH